MWWAGSRIRSSRAPNCKRSRNEDQLLRLAEPYTSPMTDGISLDLGSALPYLEDRFLALIGRDVESRGARELIEKHLRLAVRDAAYVQVVGMDRPVSIFSIYQQTRLRRRGTHGEVEVDFSRILGERENAVIFGGPGSGKTILTHYIFGQLSRSKDHLPMLFTLRWPGASRDLALVVEHLQAKRVSKAKHAHVVLLVDGYDEIATEERRRIAQSLREFAALGIGNFYLTSRSFYDVVDIVAPRAEIAPFSRGDAEGFIEAFAGAYGVTTDPATLLEELDLHGFGGFSSHPLMLALVCILKSGPMPSLPRTAIGLIRRAIDTLTFRWDEAKGVYRESRLALDGEDRIRCMMRVAFGMRALIEPEQVVLSLAGDYLRLLQKNLDPRAILMEIAQWYGMLVPTSEDQWTFVHRTLHDFLAARHWVEIGKFTPQSAAREWNARSAYAACLVPDASKHLVMALEFSPDIGPFVECLHNGAVFDTGEVAVAVVEHFARHETFSTRQEGQLTTFQTNQDFFRYASDTFVVSLTVAGVSGTTPAHQMVLAYALAEVFRRALELPAPVLNQIRTRYPGASAFEVVRGQISVKVTVSDLRFFRGATA